VGEGGGGSDALSEACEGEANPSIEFLADLKMGVGRERNPWLSVGEGEGELSKDGEGRASEGLLSSGTPTTAI
jgi:hypothetical protein